MIHGVAWQTLQTEVWITDGVAEAIETRSGVVMTDGLTRLAAR